MKRLVVVVMLGLLGCKGTPHEASREGSAATAPVGSAAPAASEDAASGSAVAAAAPADAAPVRATHKLACKKGAECGMGELGIEERAGGSIAATIKVTGGGEHECNFEGVLVADPAKADSHWTYDDNKNDLPCHVDLTRGASTYKLSSTGCRDYCGARATLAGEFELATSPPYPSE